MFTWFVFIVFFWSNVIAWNYPVCTGYNVKVQHLRDRNSKNIVYQYSFDVNINLNKSFLEKNEIIISNYTQWSFNDAVYYRSNSSYICAFYGYDSSYIFNSCLQWVPSKVTFNQQFAFQQYRLSYYTQMDSNLLTDYFDFLFDKNLMVFMGFSTEYDNYYIDWELSDTVCHNILTEILNASICCNNYINITIPDNFNNTCLEYITNTSVSLNLHNLLNFEASYVTVPDNIKVNGFQLTTSFYTDYQFSVNYYNDVNGCTKGGSDSNCYLDITTLNYAYNFVLSPRKYQNLTYTYNEFSVIVSKLRVINGVPLKENFEAFTKDDPCWIPTNSIPFANNSMAASISFCCTSFGPPPILPTTKYISPTYATFYPTETTTTSHNGIPFGHSTKKDNSSSSDTNKASINFYYLQNLFAFVVVILFVLM